jgi:hypothetical protein
MFVIVAIGTFISNAVCFTMWRGSATSRLQYVVALPPLIS